jgi:hypothetical protein
LPHLTMAYLLSIFLCSPTYRVSPFSD